MKTSAWIVGLATATLLGALSSTADAAILGHHSFSWWDDPLGAGTVVVLPMGAPGPPGGTHLVDVEEWHLDVQQTTAWYAGGAIAGMPANPFNAANRTGMTAGSVIPGVAGAEAFIYEIANVNYGSGNGPAGAPFTFTGPLPPAGANDLSGIFINDTHNALAVASPVGGTQFMFTDHGAAAKILDLTPGYVPAAQQDWDFNAYVTGGWEWDIPNWPGPADPPPPPPAVVRPGVLPAPGASAVFGYAMPGNWTDGVNDGYVHSWDFAPPMPSLQVNVTPFVFGYSGPVPEPATLSLVALGGLAVMRRRR